MAFETISLGTQPAGTGGDTARTAFEKVNRNFLAADVLAAAMSQAQFDANRNANKELYAASGWVSFGNHESGKQVNECKPGLYTVLTTPNTLLIGKAGGVGGSKTDYASVHIDGVIFNLTNQFILTLPSHPTSAMPERMDMYGVESEKVEISVASPNAYQGGLRGVGAAVNLFSATDQQKKDFFAQNSNTTYIGSDGKIYQWQLYKISFAGTTNGVPSPSEQGYTLNSFGDLWLKAGKNLLYFGNVLRLNDGGYHPSHNPLGSAKFVGDTFWYNTVTSITSKADCFNPSKLLAGSGSIASGKSGRPGLGGRYYDAVYADGYGGVCRDMRYSARHVDIINAAEVDNGTYRGFEKDTFTTLGNGYYFTKIGNATWNASQGGRYVFTINAGDTWLSNTSISSGGFKDLNSSDVIRTYYVGSNGSTWEVVAANHTYYSDIYRSGTTMYIGAGGSASVAQFNAAFPNGTQIRVIQTQETLVSVGGAFLQSDIIAPPATILATPAFANGWQGGWIPDFASGVSARAHTRKKKSNITTVSYVQRNRTTGLWSAGETPTNNVLSATALDMTFADIAILNYEAFAAQTESAPNAEIYGLVPYNVFLSSDYRPENGALLGESLIGKVLKNNIGVSVNNKSLLSCSIDSTGKLTSASNFDGVTHQALTLGAPANNSPAFKAVSYLANINQQAFIHYAYTELRHNGTSFGDDGKQTIVDNQSTKPNDHNVTVSVGTARLREPIGWFKNKV